MPPAYQLSPPSAPVGIGARRSAPPARDAAALSDGMLMAQARAGDAAAFATIYDRHAAAAYGLARRMLDNPTAAQDVVQEAFLSLWRSDAYCAEKGTLRTFVLQIVRNRAIDAFRRDRRHSAGRERDDTAVLRLAAVDRTDDEVEQRDVGRQLRAALTALPPEQQRALELAFFGGLTHREIALRLDEPIGTIKGRIRLALQRLSAEAEVASCR